MASAELADCGTNNAPLVPFNVVGAERRPLHRLAEVRREQGVSLRRVARITSTSEQVLKRQEEETSDLTLSELYGWQEALQVPVEDLLVEPGIELSRPVLERGRLVRLMKTAGSILEQSDSERVQRMAETMVSQLIEIMPELAEVSPWHAVGQRRSMDEYGRAAENPISDELFDE